MGVQERSDGFGVTGEEVEWKAGKVKESGREETAVWAEVRR